MGLTRASNDVLNLANLTSVSTDSLTVNGDATITSKLTVGNLTVVNTIYQQQVVQLPSTAYYGNVLPNANVQYTLGSISSFWDTLYTDSIIVNGIHSTFISVGDLAVSGNANLSSDTSISGNLSVVKELTANGNLRIMGNLVVGSNISTSSNLIVSKNIIGSGIISTSGNISTTGNGIIGGNLVFTSTSSFINGGTLINYNATQHNLYGTVVTKGPTFVEKDMSIFGNLSTSGYIGVTGYFSGPGTGLTGVAPNFTAGNVSIFPTGTRLMFQQTTAPTGWTKDTTAALNDSILRIVTGVVGSGGSAAFSTWNAVTSTGSYTLQTADIPSHSHTASDSGHNHTVSDPGHIHPMTDNGHSHGVNDPGHSHTYTLYGQGVNGVGAAAGTWRTTASTVASTTGISIAASGTGIYVGYASAGVTLASGTASVSIGSTGGSGGHSHSLSRSIKYNDIIIATKN